MNLKLPAVATAAAMIGVVGVITLPGLAAPQGMVQVASLIETQPSSNAGDNIDDPALWVNPADPAASLVVGNEKLARQMSVYNLRGERVQTVTNAGKYFGNVDVRGQYIVAATSGVTAYRVVNGLLVPAMEATGNASTAGEGLCLWNSPTGLFAITVVKTNNRVRVHPLTDVDRDGLLQLQPAVKEWYNASEGESCEVDDATGTLYLSEEDLGIWRVNLNDSRKAPPRTMLVPVANSLSPDIEGLAVVGDVLIASAQNVASPQANWYSTFNKNTGAFLNSFRISNSATSDDCDETDGLLAYKGNLGPTFPNGIFICQDGYNAAPGPSGAQNFKLVPLERLPGFAVTPPTPTEPTQPTVTAPTSTEPTVTEPTITAPTSTEPTVTEPTSTEPTITDPPTTEPPTSTPTEPTVTEPTATEPTGTLPTCG